MHVWLHNQEARDSLWGGRYIAPSYDHPHVQTNIPYKQNTFAHEDLLVHMYGHVHVDMWVSIQGTASSTMLIS